MTWNKLLICLLVFYECHIAFAGLRRCSSCILLRECPEALSVAGKNDSESITKLTLAVCGTKRVNGQKLPKVCCSDFIDVGTRSSNKEFEQVNIETHKNIALLPESCGDPNADRIIGGDFANLYEFPWMTLISHVTGKYRGKNKYEFKCGGTLISSRYVLTAAHCVHDKNVAGVRVGEFNINTKEDCQGEYPHRTCETHLQDIKIAKAIVHEEYSKVTFARNDIALLRLKKPVDFTYKNAKPICLPIYESLRNLSLDLKRAVVAGWGITEFNMISPILRKVTIPIKTDNECREYYDKNADTYDIMQNKLCAGEDGKDSCRGDSGGPLMLEEEYNSTYRMVQFGVVSFGPQRCGSTTPGVYTDVRKYMKWILDNMEE